MKAFMLGPALVAILSAASIAAADEVQTPPPAVTPSPAPAAVPATEKEKPAEEPVYVRDHRTVRSFPANLGHNVLAVWEKPSIAPLLVGAAGTGAGFLIDDETVKYFDKHEWKRYGDAGAIIGTGVTAGAVAGILFGVGHYANGDRFRAAAYDTGQAVLVNALYTTVIKESVRRQRPDGGNRLSFPSGHASNAFACAAVWEAQYGWKAGVPGYTAAALIAGSRLASKKHHMSDIVAGAALGYIVGKSVARYDSQPSRKLAPGEKVRVGFFPDGGPDGSGVGLRMAVQF